MQTITPKHSTTGVHKSPTHYPAPPLPVTGSVTTPEISLADWHKDILEKYKKENPVIERTMEIVKKTQEMIDRSLPAMEAYNRYVEAVRPQIKIITTTGITH